MKKSRFSESQIIAILKQANAIPTGKLFFKSRAVSSYCCLDCTCSLYLVACICGHRSFTDSNFRGELQTDPCAAWPLISVLATGLSQCKTPSIVRQGRTEKMNCKAFASRIQKSFAFKALVALLLSTNALSESNAASNVIVFYLDDRYRPVAKPERLQPLSDGTKAILAMYALQIGAGCGGRRPTDEIHCELTTALGLGAQCSAQHISLVRTWFVNGIPQINGYGTEHYKGTQKPGNLEAVCYKTPDTASRQQAWQIIRVTQKEQTVSVDAIESWVTPNGDGRLRYQTDYRLNANTVDVIQHRVIYDKANLYE